MDNILTVIPARGGSKRVPKKNIKMMNGKPLIHYVLTAAKNSKLVGDIVVSTDSDEIFDIVEPYGVFRMGRPEYLQSDAHLIIEVLKHVIQSMNAHKLKYDAVLSLQPTSPLLTSETIDEVINKYYANKHNGCKAVATVTRIRNNMHPYLSKVMILHDCMVNVMTETIGRTPQYPTAVDDTPVYYCNGAAFLRHRDLLLDLDYITNALGFGFLGVEMKEEESINIDTQLDFDIAEFLLNRKNK
jgi:CMP-N-acetylneuraminic acid synthetase